MTSLDPPALPSGTVTLLFTDIEDSTPLFHALGDQMLDVIEQHNALIRAAVAPHGGHEVKTEGDALFIGFASAPAALAACIDAQRALLAHDWPGGSRVRVRMGLHVGSVHVVGHDYIGIAVAEAARVSAAAHGAQVLVSEDVAAAVAAELPEGTSLHDLGKHLLKGFPEPRHLYEVRHPDLPAGFPSPRTLTGTEHNLPAPPTPIVGRDREMELVRTALLGDARLVTLTGPGGIGKTRLSVEAARAVLAYTRGGAWFVELAAVTDPAGIMPAIARVLGVAERPGVPLADVVLGRLAQDPALLVLDNFEQVLDGSLVVSQLLAASATTKVLATSRERLRVRGEHEIMIEPLPCPDQASQVEDAPAGRLFLERARAADARFTLDAASAAEITAICVKCHGIPLALELAAARVREMSTGELAAALGRGIELLSEGDRDLPPRHQALRATIAWSYDALPADEQRVFRRFAAFTGGAPLDALEAVCGDGAHAILRSLSDRSMVRFNGGRVSMLEPIRQYALELLDAEGERAHAEEAHGSWFLHLAQRADASITGPDQAHWLETLGCELDNARGALTSQHVDVDTRVAMAAALGRFWEIRGYWTEGRAWLDGVLTDASGSPAVRGRALLGAGALALRQADRQAARVLLDEALTIAGSIDDPLLEGHVLNQFGTLARLDRDSDAALAYSEGALNAMRRSGDPRGIALAVLYLSANLLDRGDLERARESSEEAVDRARALGDRRTVALAFQNLGLIAQQHGDLESARRLLVEALAAHRANGDGGGSAGALTNLGLVAYHDGDVSGARGAWEEALHEARTLGDRALVARLLANLVGLSDHDASLSLTHASEGAGLFVELGDPARATRLLTVAAAARIKDEPHAAETAFARAESIAREAGDPGLVADVLDAAATALDEAGRVEDARLRMRRCLDAARAAGDPERIRQAEQVLDRLAMESR